ncbi:MAG: hypothetical protein JST41_11865 [Bacteroidetes bacterium]|nr:hypothetical protein [Bacteroidota bacterium]MBX7127895.1 hypothetical protein [Flavobacteriales bacterium]MCC6655395.1 hypothetical protein [Flavobacteriales bacterium]HMU12735.1 hypothetical protein [Flavobacteriales bacterium]HMW97939.1 hypothetical protein [Flavobacteriales bacterium]
MRRPWVITTVGAALGAAAGWFYWYQWGCTNGCAITGNPMNSTLYGALLGGLLFNSFKKPAGQGARG